MQRIPALNPQEATGRCKDHFDAIQKKFGMVPNMMRTMGNSPAVLNGYISFKSALGESSIGGKLSELIAIAISNINGCDYCNTAHSFVGEKLAGLKPEAIDLARDCKAEDLKTEIALQFVQKLVEKKGKVSQNDITAVKNAGFNDGELAEMISQTALTIFTNYFANAAELVIDFPKAKAAEFSN